jgi:hypothetical protein
MMAMGKAGRGRAVCRLSFMADRAPPFNGDVRLFESFVSPYLCGESGWLGFLSSTRQPMNHKGTEGKATEINRRDQTINPAHAEQRRRGAQDQWQEDLGQKDSGRVSPRNPWSPVAPPLSFFANPFLAVPAMLRKPGTKTSGFSPLTKDPNQPSIGGQAADYADDAHGPPFYRHLRYLGYLRLKALAEDREGTFLSRVHVIA